MMLDMGLPRGTGFSRPGQGMKTGGLKALRSPNMETVHLVSKANTSNFYSKMLSEFRLKGILCDVVFSFCQEGTQTAAHRVVLACHSDFFRSIFGESQISMSQKSPFLIDKATPYIFEFLLEFMYSGKIEVPRNVVFDLCKVAYEYQVAELRTLCIRSLSETFSLQSCFQLPATQHQPIALPAGPMTSASIPGSEQPAVQQESSQQIDLLVLAQQALLDKTKRGQDENKSCNNLLKKAAQSTTGVKTCCVENCRAAARHSSKYCINHGSKICSFENCTTGARGGSKFCVTHGGGRRCAVHNCNTSARGRSKLCILHGGGKRCSIKFCNKSARGGSQKCISHGGGRLCDNATCSKPRSMPGKYCDAHAHEEKSTEHGGKYQPQSRMKRSRYPATSSGTFKILSPVKPLENNVPKKLGRPPKKQRTISQRAVLALKNE